MIEDLWRNLTHNIWITIFFLVFWPLLAALVIGLFGKSKDGARFRPCKALYCSIASYAGISQEELKPATMLSKWLILIHRLIGILAWAYIIAIFIATIR